MKEQKIEKKKLGQPETILNPGKKIFFYAVIIVMPIILLILLELTLRLFSVGKDLSLFVTAPNPKYYEINRIVGERYFNNKFARTTPTPRLQYFLKKKPKNEYRIFVLGGSTAEGFPYNANLTFPRILKRMLRDVFPKKKIEVINLGMSAVNSYTLLDFANEVIQQKPDVILIYAGHNEYYGALGVASMDNGSVPTWMKRLRLNLVHFRIYQLLEKGITGIFKLIHPSTSSDEKATLMERMVGKDLVPYDSKKYYEGLNQFHDNMKSLIVKFINARVPVIISDLVSNIGDQPPFRSLAYKEFPRADSTYSIAKRLESKHRFGEAKQKFILAKDLDAIRFRAPEDINTIITHLADSLGIFSISMEKLFEKYSPNKIVGSNLIIDHLHPDINGYFLMAEGFFDALKNYGMIDDDWDTLKIKPWTYYRDSWGYTKLDSMIAVLRIKHLRAGWPFKPEGTINNFRNNYIPNGIVDSLAFMTIQFANVSPEMVHKKLAAYYESLGKYKLASKEYLAIAYSTPLGASAYYHAANLSLKDGDSTDALRYLNEAPGADTSSYALFTIASIYSVQHKNKEALFSIAKLERLHPNQNILLQALKLKYKVQKDSGLIADAEKTLSIIEKVDPSFSRKSGKESITILIPEKIKPYIDRARKLIQVREIPQALEVLKQANKIQEIAYSDMLIGKILFAEKNIGALTYLEKAKKEIKKDPSMYYELSILYLIKNNMKRAEYSINDFARLAGENNPQYKQLKSIYEKKLAE